MKVAIIKTPIGKIALCINVDVLVCAGFVDSHTPLHQPECLITKHMVQQIDAYFVNPKHQFDIKLTFNGKAFQKKVWQQMQKIPSGTVLTYGELAEQINSSARPVGNACAINPLALIIPCHRVVATQGIGGYFRDDKNQFMLEKKLWLLEHEKCKWAKEYKKQRILS